MSLKPLRQTQEVNIDFITPWTQERGGCLTLASASGMTFVQYSHDPSGVVPIGIQLNDVEWMNLTRHYHRAYSPAATTDVPCSRVGIAEQGDFITDWLYLIGTVGMGDTAYVGPSGTFTNISTLGGNPIGTFIGPLDVDPHFVVMRGLGFSREYIDCHTKLAVWENNPADRVLVHSPGYIKIRVDIGLQNR